MPKIAWILLPVLLVLCAPAFAADSDLPLRDACQEDVQKLCPDVRAGGGRIAVCLQSQIDNVSPGCRTAIEEAKKRVRHAVDACKDDIRKYCAGMKPGTPQMSNCLKENIKSFSPDCREVVERAASKAGK